MSTPTPSDAHDLNRPHSIDLSLELEHQLALEDTDEHPSTSPTRARPASLDPAVVAHLIGELRGDLENITQERNDLLKMIEKHTSTESDLKDTLSNLEDRFTTAQEELQLARQKAQDDQENISMLRAKVEESR